MPSLCPIEIRFFPRFQVPRISPWFILWGLLFSALIWTSVSSYIFPSLFDGTSTINNILGYIRSASMRHDIEPNRIAAPFDPDNADAEDHHVGVVPRGQHSYRYVALPSPTMMTPMTTVIASMASNTISTTEKTIKPIITRRPRLPHSHRRLPHLARRNDFNTYLHDSQGRYDDDGFLISGMTSPNPDSPTTKTPSGVPYIPSIYRTSVPSPLGEVNDIPGTFAKCARPCMKKAVELNTDCEDPLDLECTCRPENRAVLEAASDECCWQACGHGVPEIL